jgi:hypothetical protein
MKGSGMRYFAYFKRWNNIPFFFLEVM